MSVESQLIDFVVADPTVSGLIVARMTAIYAPEDGEAPYIVFRRMATPRLETMEGAGTPYPTFRITCWAETYEGAIVLADAVRARLDGAKGQWGGTLTIQRVKVQDESDVFDPYEREMHDVAYGRQFDVEIWHSE